MRSYSRLSADEREYISIQMVRGESYRVIARRLKRAPSTISREVSKGLGCYGNYRPIKAHRRAQERASQRKQGKHKLFRNPRLARLVYKKLHREFWSPKQTSEWLKRRYPDDKTMQVSHEAIYTYIYILPRGQLKETLRMALRQCHEKRKRRRSMAQKAKRGGIKDMLSIEERPAEVADRTMPGHWEGDLLVGGQNQSALGTIVERTTRSLILVPIKSRNADEVRRAFARELKKLPKQMRLSLTYDQGKEMAEHRLFTEQTKMKVFFAHPGCPWERGTNENTNGLLRQFFPKYTNFDNVSRYRIKRVQHLMNARPRKVLDYRTPYEAMRDLLR